MALAINPNVISTATQGTAEANMAQLNQALDGRAGTAGAALQMEAETDSAEFASHTEAAPITSPVKSPDAATALAQQAHTHIMADPDGAIAVQGGAARQSVFALMQ